MADEQQLVLTGVNNGVATITLNRPDRRNAMNRAMIAGMRAAFDAVRDDTAVRVVVIRGNGPVFTSGIDVAYLFEGGPEGVPARHGHHDLQDTFHRLERMEKPVVAVVHGLALGMGLELALACDFRLALRGAVFGLPEVMFGINPDVGGLTRLVRTIGVARAKEMILTGKVITSETADRFGLVTAVADDEADLDRRLARLIGQLTNHPPAAVGLTKSLIQQSADIDSATSFQLEGTVVSALGMMPQADDLAERARAFMRDQMADPE